MLNFFKRIRQQLLTENKFTRYLLYAVGEVTLVIVGILIALQINILKENKETRKKEIVYLANILQDLNQEANDIRRMIKFKESQANAADTIVNFIEGKISSDPISIITNQVTVFYWLTHHPNNNSFSELKNSGQLSMITSNDIRLKLLKLDSKYLELAMIEDHIKYEYHEFLYKKNINSIDYKLMFNVARLKKKISKSDSIVLVKNMQSIKGDMVLKNAYVLASLNNSYYAGLSKDVLKIVEEVIELIKTDIQK